MKIRSALRPILVSILSPAAVACATGADPPRPPDPPVPISVPEGDRLTPLVTPFRPGADDILRDLAAWDAASPEARTARAAALLPQLRGFVLSGLLRFECGTQEHQVAVFRHERTGLEFVLVPAGRVASSGERSASEAGRREFAVHSPFLIARTEVTRRALAIGPAGEPLATDDDPDVAAGGVSCDRALAYCRAMGLDLPTEQQWEFACRAGAETPYCHGPDPTSLDAYAWTGGNSGGRLHRVGEKRPNAFGILDLHGNAREWTRDADRGSAQIVVLGEGADAPVGARRRIRRCPDTAEWMHGFRPVVTIPARSWDPSPGRAVRRVSARGVQRYRLDRRAGGTLAWTFVGPKAELLDEEGRVVGDHFMTEEGPCWEIGNDCIFARKAVERPSQRTGSIPELQLDVTDAAGDGLFDGVVTIERIDTVGGAAPEGAGSNVEGDLIEIPYTATYVFYAVPGPGTAPTDVTLRSAR